MNHIQAEWLKSVAHVKDQDGMYLVSFDACAHTQIYIRETNMLEHILFGTIFLPFSI